MCWLGCRRRKTARSKNYCRIAGSQQNPNFDFVPSRQPCRQGVLATRLRWLACRRRKTVRSTNCCHTAGSPPHFSCESVPERHRRSQGVLAARLRINHLRSGSVELVLLTEESRRVCRTLTVCTHVGHTRCALMLGAPKKKRPINRLGV
jgi:hypothetical protein